MARSNSLKSEILSVLLKTARFRLLNPVFNLVFKHLGNFMSAENLYESSYWRALYHPKPLYPLHVLILPKISIASLVEAPNDTPDLYLDLFEVIKILIEKFNFENCDYRLITNGGPNQSVPQWHWYLISKNFGEISD